MKHAKEGYPQKTATTSGRQTAFACGLIVFLLLVAYANSLRVPFVFDDQSSILENPTIRQLSWRALSPPHGEGATVEGRPVLNLSLAFNYVLGGLDERGYHAVNLAIHALAALTLFGLVRRTLSRMASAISVHADGIALATALLWALHPLQTESVTYIVQRTESLMGLFYLLTLYGFVRGVEAGARSWFAVSWVACALGMATKEVMVSAPLLVLLYDRTFVSGEFREAWQRHRSFYLGLAASWLVLGALVLNTGSRGGTIGASAGVAWWEYALCQSRAILRYLWLSLWPNALTFDYGADFATFGEVLPFALLDLALVAGTFLALRRRSAWGFLGVWFFFILAPTSSVVGGTRQMLAEHRMYLSLAALALAAAVGLHVWLGRRSWFAWGVLAIGLTILTVQRNHDYRTPLALYRDTVAKRPGNPYAHNNLGKALLGAGRLPEAVASFQAALRLAPTLRAPRIQRGIASIAHNNLAGAFAKLGRTDEALAQAKAALEENSGSADAHYNLATGLLRQGQADAAVTEFEIALRIQPNHVDARCNLATALLRLGRSDEALRQYEEALRIRPDYAEGHYSLAVAQQQLGQGSAAIEHYQSALRLRPDHPEAHNNLGVLLQREGRVVDAIEHYRAALQARPDYLEARINLGEALAETNRLPEARAEFEAALRLDPASAAAQYGVGNCLAASGRAAEAIPYFEAAVRAAPDNAQYHNNLASALFEGANRIDEAIAHFNTSLRLQPASAETHCNLGVVLAARGDRTEARRHLEEALRLQPDYAFARDELAKLRAGARP